MRGGFIGARKHVQATQDDLGPAPTIPRRQLVRPIRERQMDRDSDDLRKRLPWRRALQQVFVPVRDFPVRRRRAGDARQRQRRRQHVLAETRVRILGIERVDQKRKLRLRWARFNLGIEARGRRQRAESTGYSWPSPLLRESL